MHHKPIIIVTTTNSMANNKGGPTRIGCGTCYTVSLTLKIDETSVMARSISFWLHMLNVCWVETRESLTARYPAQKQPDPPFLSPLIQYSSQYQPPSVATNEV